MGSIVTLQNEIEAIIASMDQCTYLRAKESEANIALEEMKVDDCLVIQMDQTTVTGQFITQSHIVKIIPLEILFVYKNNDLGDNQKEIDTMVDQAEDKADQLHDLLIQSSVINDLAELDDYSLNRLEGYKRFDAILSGVLYTWDAPVLRTKYYCE